MLFFFRRGRQNFRQLKKTDFEINVNSQGTKRCVVKTTDEVTKNHRAHDVQAEEGGMVITNDRPFCPVSSFEKYLSVLNPMNEYLFQRPKKSAGEGEIWYDNMVVLHSRQEDENHLRLSGVLNNIHKSFNQSDDHNYTRQKWI